MRARSPGRTRAVCTRTWADGTYLARVVSREASEASEACAPLSDSSGPCPSPSGRLKRTHGPMNSAFALPLSAARRPAASPLASRAHTRCGFWSCVTSTGCAFLPYFPGLWHSHLRRAFALLCACRALARRCAWACSAPLLLAQPALRAAASRASDPPAKPCAHFLPARSRMQEYPYPFLNKFRQPHTFLISGSCAGLVFFGIFRVRTHAPSLLGERPRPLLARSSARGKWRRLCL